MISDLSRTLYAILKQNGLPKPLADADILFDRPTDPYNPQKTTVNLFLYDIRENLELRNNEPRVKLTNQQAIFSRPPLRVACSYLVTAWPVGGQVGGQGVPLPLQEQHLLSQVLQVLSMYPVIPDTFLRGNLVGTEPPVPMVALHPDSLKNLSDFWTALGIKMRSSITVTVTIAMDIFKPEPPVPLVITEEMKLGERQSPEKEIILPGTLEDSFRVGGRVTNTSNNPVIDATISVIGLGLTAKTDSRGCYILGRMIAGTYTLHVQSSTLSKDVTITVPATSGNNYNITL